MLPSNRKAYSRRGALSLADGIAAWAEREIVGVGVGGVSVRVVDIVGDGDGVATESESESASE